MFIWIITTGNTDIQLEKDNNWIRGAKLFNKYSEKNLTPKIDRFNSITKEKEIFPVPSRALGLVYENHQEHYQDLRFPLLDTFCKQFTPENKPDQIYIFLTDQTSIFTDKDQKLKDCPFWQDTITLQPIFKWYFEKKLKITPEFITIKPSNNAEKKGIDNWEEMLKVVREELLKLNINKDKVVYVSHQASTPAISSAVQFVTIGLFSNVNFLISNQFYENGEQKAKADLISSSNYWRDLQIQTVKKVLNRWDFDGASQLLQTLKLSSNNLLKSVNKALNITVGYFNLDDSNINQIRNDHNLEWLKKIDDDYDALLNLYTQCRIFWELNQIADFLWRMSSFYEEVLYTLADNLDGDIDEFQELNNRFSKREFVTNLIKDRNDSQEKIIWKIIEQSLKKLDFWAEQRNHIIHYARGWSKDNLANQLNQARQNNRGRTIRDNVNNACQSNQILIEMTNILKQKNKLIDQPSNEYIGVNNTPYYIYSEVKDWVIEQLDNLTNKLN
jgi:hypothetical protein